MPAWMGPDVTVSNGDRDANVTVSPTHDHDDGGAWSASHRPGQYHAECAEPTAPVTFQVRVSDGAEGQITDCLAAPRRASRRTPIRMCMC